MSSSLAVAPWTQTTHGSPAVATRATQPICCARLRPPSFRSASKAAQWLVCIVVPPSTTCARCPNLLPPRAHPRALSSIPITTATPAHRYRILGACTLFLLTFPPQICLCAIGPVVRLRPRFRSVDLSHASTRVSFLFLSSPLVHNA
ncbi:hypothetical protein B0H15DRAFT_1027590 [Mycena belliarum]|uniref:Uncharacterized protein n=1 Tax=Mycena belliarum TaxID=1033014 RepID=A0AAD6TSR4_9AGAR|nr:hypothetical protein B0H15DRAFT_1027590 [Mycena belliae]